jgi:hypothetical protein
VIFSNKTTERQNITKKERERHANDKNEERKMFSDLKKNVRKIAQM